MSVNTESLSVVAAAEAIGVPRSALVRLLAEETGSVSIWLRVDDKKRIPSERLPVLKAWAERRDDERYKPLALARSLSEGVDLDAVLLGEPGSPADLVLPNLPANQLAVNMAQLEPVRHFIEEIVAQSVRAVAASALPPPPDSLLTESEAQAKLGGVTPKRRVKGFKLGGEVLYRESDVYRYIQQLGQPRRPR